MQSSLSHPLRLWHKTHSQLQHFQARRATELSRGEQTESIGLHASGDAAITTAPPGMFQAVSIKAAVSSGIVRIGLPDLARPGLLRRRRPSNGHIDLMEWLTNSGAYRLSGGLNMLSKLLGKPGKLEVRGEKVYPMFLEGKIQEINDYCMFDTLDTFFVLLRTRVLTGELTLEDEHFAVLHAREWIQQQVSTVPALQKYLDNWGECSPWP